MFTLGNKEAIVNSTNKFKITNAGVTTWAANVDTLSIAGFANFDKAQIVSGGGNRYAAGKPGALRIVTPTAAELGILTPEVNVATVVHVRLFSSRDSSEWANDFIKRGRPIIFELSISYGDTADTIADKLLAAFAKHESTFILSEGLPFTYSKTTQGTNVAVTLVAKADDLSFAANVEFLRRQETFGVKVATNNYVVDAVTGATALVNATTIPVTDSSNFKVGDTIAIYDASENVFLTETAKVLTIASGTTLTVPAPGFSVALEATDVVYIVNPGYEAVNSGKYLEENVSVGTAQKATPYALNSGEVPDVAGSYSMITWVAKATDTDGVAKTWAPHKNLSIVAADAETGTRNQTFTLYFNEDSSLLASGGVVEILVDWLIDTAGITVADFVLANGTNPADGAAFVA